MSDTLQGLGNLLAAIQDLTTATSGDNLVEAGKVGTHVLLDGMRRRVPVRTGELRDSLEVAVETDQADHAVISVETSKSYAAPVEFGTIHQSAQPFMRPTVDIDGDTALDVVAQVLGRKIEQVSS